MRVEELMTKDPLVAEVPGQRDDVLKLLVKHSVSGMPVVKSGTRELVGVITRSDIFRKPDQHQTALVMSSKPFTIGPKDDVKKAAALFFEHKIHGLPVVVKNELVGVISPTDILKVIVDAGTKTPVQELMNNSVCPAHESTPLRVVWEIMRLGHHNAVPVLDDEANLVGIVSDSDLFKQSQVEELAKKGALTLDTEGDHQWDRFRSVMPFYLAASAVEIPKAPVSEAMVRDVQTVFAKTSIAEAAKKMRKYRINQLPVLDTKDRLKGTITDLDLMRAEM